MKKTGENSGSGAQPRRFSADLRDRFVGMVEAGRPQEDAAAAIGVSLTTVKRWRAKGEKQPGTPAAEFAAKLKLAVDGADTPLTEADVRRALEKAIEKKGSVSAMKLWTELYGAKSRAKTPPVEEPTTESRSWIDDELAARRRAA